MNLRPSETFATPTSPFFNLPAELRNKIYEYAFIDPGSTISLTGPEFRVPRSTFVSRQFWVESFTIFLRTNRFSVLLIKYHGVHRVATITAHHWLKRLGLSQPIFKELMFEFSRESRFDGMEFGAIYARGHIGILHARCDNPSHGNYCAVCSDGYGKPLPEFLKACTPAAIQARSTYFADLDRLARKHDGIARELSEGFLFKGCDHEGISIHDMKRLACLIRQEDSGIYVEWLLTGLDQINKEYASLLHRHRRLWWASLDEEEMPPRELLCTQATRTGLLKKDTLISTE